jgi:hypothetical protein
VVRDVRTAAAHARVVGARHAVVAVDRGTRHAPDERLAPLDSVAWVAVVALGHHTDLAEPTTAHARAAAEIVRPTLDWLARCAGFVEAQLRAVAGVAVVALVVSTTLRAARVDRGGVRAPAVACAAVESAPRVDPPATVRRLVGRIDVQGQAATCQ